MKFDKPQPEKYEKALLIHGIKLETREYIAWKIHKAHYDRFNSISKEKRNEILRLLRESHTIGEIRKKMKLDFEVVNSVIFLNLQDVTILRSDSL